MTECGIIYIAMGRNFVEEAVLSAESVQKKNSKIPITIFTDHKISKDVFDNVIVVDDPDYGFRDKINYLRKSPYEKTIFLDTDTYVAGDISELFSILDRFDIGAAHNNDHQRREANEVALVPESFPEYNTGVITFRTDAVQNLSKEWKEAYSMEHSHDQPSFRKAVYESDLRLATIPPEYNCLFRYPGHSVGEVKIFHGRLLDFDTEGAGKYYEIDEAVSSINSETGSRIFYPRSTGGYSVKPSRTLPRRIRLSIKERGVIGTVKRAVRMALGILV
ncbi:glycosyltransferase [Halovenus halobia]|uniref:glycosyltransferase n=1 Tax=Halovenus halobia TaxID=3396622 RepID=UPI003F559041